MSSTLYFDGGGHVHHYDAVVIGAEFAGVIAARDLIAQDHLSCVATYFGSWAAFFETAGTWPIKGAMDTGAHAARKVAANFQLDPCARR